ncbi:MAG: FKBP-type peptidyl-prolyl cis-trans isomerase [Bacteroidetes bacterium]|nr:FKBP-type peptidyl-prolyl cis-trans isomerase [Bacteroidota bacterium]
MTTKRQLAIIVITTLFALSCGNRAGFEKTNDGLQFKYLYRSDSKVLPQIGQILFINYIIKTENDSLLFSTYNDLRRQDKIELQEPQFKGGDIFSALAMMSEGDSMAFLISADSFYLKTRGETQLPSNIKAGSFLTFIIKLEKIVNAQDYEAIKNRERYERLVSEVGKIDSFFKARDWKDSKLENGIRYYITDRKEQAKKVKIGDEVEFHYIGTLLENGAEFVNSYLAGGRAKFIVGDEQIKPEAMNYMLLQMHEGEKATFVVPFDLAFGEYGVANLVPPYATVIYEIFLVKVKE